MAETDLAACREKGLTVFKMDQSFLDFPDGQFDFLWCRHCLEHSIFPYYTLSEFFRVLRPGGYAYIEVPAPDTPSNHHANPNHYSVLGKQMWENLFLRSGFAGESLTIQVTTMGGFEDLYWGFLLQKT